MSGLPQSCLSRWCSLYNWDRTTGKRGTGRELHLKFVPHDKDIVSRELFGRTQLPKP